MSDPFEPALLVSAIGWALLQSLWQGTVIGAATALALVALRRRSATWRYVAACMGLLAMAVAFATTVIGAAQGGRTRAALAHEYTAPVVAWAADSGTASVQPLPIDLEQGATTRWWSGERQQTWSTIAVPIWLLGVIVLSTRLAAGWVFVERMRRRATRPLPDSWDARVRAIASRLGVRTPVAVLESGLVHVPTVIGAVRPVVLIPICALSGLSVAQLEAVMAHELAHVKRHDYLVNLLQSIVEVLLFYHPVTWWISHHIRIEREHCCDDMAAVHCGSRLTYARALADLEALRGSSPALGLAATDGPLTRRVRRILATPAAATGQPRSWVVAVAVSLVLIAAITGSRFHDVLDAAAAPQSAVPGAGQGIPASEGGVRGRVVDARSGNPIQGASLDLVVDDRRGGGSAAAGLRYRASTGEDGRFEIAGVTPGRYLLTAGARGYITASFGRPSPVSPPSGLQVRGGQVTSGVDMRLEPSGAIHGRVLTNAGRGLPGIEVELLHPAGGSVPVAASGPRRRAAAFAQTEDDGAFRFRDVPPGEYYVRAYAPDSIRPERSARSVRFAPTYFPEGTDGATAQPLVLHEGQELFDIEFTLATAETLTVRGRVLDPGGPPVATAYVALMSLGGMNVGPREAGVAADGAFEIKDVPAGLYMLNVRDPAEPRRWMSAMRAIEITGETSVEIVAAKPADLEGRITREGGGPFPFDIRDVRILAERRLDSPAGGSTGAGPGRGGIAEDGTFSIGSFAGTVSIAISDVPSGWMVKAVLLDGLDVTDEPVDLAAGNRHRLEVVLTNRVSGVTGTVTDRSNRRVWNAVVVIFPDDQARWGASRVVRTAVTDQDGRYAVPDLPAGSYRAVAVASLPTVRAPAPDLLEQLWPLASSLRLYEADQQMLPLTLAPIVPLQP